MKKQTRLIIFCLFLSALFLAVSGCTPAPPALPTPEPPQPGQEVVEDVALSSGLSLSGPWKYQKIARWDDAITQSDFDDSAWGEVSVPASWDAQGMPEDIGQGTVVVYRKEVEVPRNWRGQPVGISAWFNPYASRVFVNGTQVEPKRKPFAPYADVSQQLKYGASNTIAVAVQYDGYLEFSEAEPPRIGVITMRPVTKVVQEPVTLNTAAGAAEGLFFYPAEKNNLPALVLAATGSHGLGELSSWTDLAADLARSGYASLVVAMPDQSHASIQAAIAFLRDRPTADPSRTYLFGVDAAAPAVVIAAGEDTRIRGVILLSAPLVDGAEALAGRPVLLMAAKGDRGGFFVEQAKTTASLVGPSAEVISLPGDGHGTFVFQNTWNAVRTALLDWLKSTGQ